MNIKNVVVLGANGTMGKNISLLFFSLGFEKIFMVSRKLKDSKEAKQSLIMSYKGTFLTNRLIPLVYDDLKIIMNDVDLVYESVGENLSIKKEVYSKLNPLLNSKIIIATGTSGLSIDELVEIIDIKYRKNFLGIHFFNPPLKLTLCELIPSVYTDIILINNIKSFLTSSLFRDVVIVKNSEGFLANRVGFQFLNYILRQAENFAYLGGIDYIDYVFGNHSGRNLSPNMTIDYVGLDIHKAIVENLSKISNNIFKQTLEIPSFIYELIESKSLGRKTKIGLYKRIENSDGTFTTLVYDIKTKLYRDTVEYNSSDIENIKKFIFENKYDKAREILLLSNSLESNLLLEGLLIYAIYGIYVGELIGENLHSIDIAMSKGFSWIPPLSVIDFFGGREEFIDIIKSRMKKEFINEINLDNISKITIKSNFYFKDYMISIKR